MKSQAQRWKDETTNPRSKFNRPFGVGSPPYNENPQSNPNRDARLRGRHAGGLRLVFSPANPGAALQRCRPQLEEQGPAHPTASLIPAQANGWAGASGF